MKNKHRTPYEAARHALARHLWHHHGQLKAKGPLTERLEFHDDLHWSLGSNQPHQHAEMPDDETQEQTAERYFEEGESPGAMSG